MRVAVVYESMYGNTRTVAQAIAEGFRSAAPDAAVECSRTDQAESAAADADLLVVGGPTHFLGMASPRSRRLQHQTIEHGKPYARGHRPEREPGSPHPGPEGVREWLEELPSAVGGRRAAAFDTRLGKLMVGSAARQIGRALGRHGYQLVDHPQGFVVDDYRGPLAHGELERAREWGAALAAQTGAGAPAPRPART